MTQERFDFVIVGAGAAGCILANRLSAEGRYRANLSVRTDAQAMGLIIEERKAKGLRYKRGGSLREVYANREIILCAGAVNTPKLLQLSGVGSSAHLRSIGVDPIHELPGVGENLRYHYLIRLVAHAAPGVATINGMSRGWPLLREIGRRALGRPSFIAIGPSVCYGFTNASHPDLPPDVQLNFTPGSYKASVSGLLDTFEGATLGVYQLRPPSLR